MTNKKGDTTGDKEAEGRQGGHNDQQEGGQQGRQEGTEEGRQDRRHRETDTVTNKKGEKTGDKKKQKEDKADTMTNKKGDKKGDKRHHRRPPNSLCFSNRNTLQLELATSRAGRQRIARQRRPQQSRAGRQMQTQGDKCKGLQATYSPELGDK